MYVCEELEARRIRAFLKQTQRHRIGPIWLKTKLKIDSEILRIDPESLERESRCIDLFLHP